MADAVIKAHLSIHTWPEYLYAAVDIFSCGDVVQPQAAIDHLTQVFGAERISVVELQRGILVGSPTLSLHT